MVLLKGPRRGGFLCAKYPCIRKTPYERRASAGKAKEIQGYLTYKKTHLPRTLPQAYG